MTQTSKPLPIFSFLLKKINLCGIILLKTCEDYNMDKESIRKELKCKIFSLNTLETYKYVVVCTYYNGSWILSKHKDRDTWETQGGHIEVGETPLECAKRELYEESGITDADIYPVCDYLGYNSFASANGMVFLALVKSIGNLPKSEMKEIAAFKDLPENLTYPNISPMLYKEAQKIITKYLQIL